MVNVMAAPATDARADGRRFYLMMAGVFLIVAFGGFTPSYWGRLANGTYHGAPIFHIHGFLLFSWTCFYFVQTALVAAHRTPDHRPRLARARPPASRVRRRRTDRAG